MSSLPIEQLHGKSPVDCYKRRRIQMVVMKGLRKELAVAGGRYSNIYMSAGLAQTCLAEVGVGAYRHAPLAVGRIRPPFRHCKGTTARCMPINEAMKEIECC